MLSPMYPGFMGDVVLPPMYPGFKGDVVLPPMYPGFMGDVVLSTKRRSSKCLEIFFPLIISAPDKPDVPETELC